MPASPTDAPRPHRTRLKVILLAAAVAVVIAGWSAYWMVLSGRVETMLRATLADPLPDGTVATCSPLAVAGYPFRIEARCGTVAADLPDGTRLSAGSLVAVALAYDWRRAIIELDGPLAVVPAAAPPLEASWTTARASVTRAGALLANADVAVVEPVVTLAGTAFASAAEVEAHARRTPGPDGGSDLAVSAKGLSAAQLPLPVPLDVAAVVQVGDGGAVLRGRGPLVEGIGEAPLPISVRSLSVAAAGARLSATGDLTLDAEGRLDGSLAVTVVDVPALAGLLARLLPPDSPLPTAIAGAVAALGRDAGDGGRTVPVTIRRGRASIGFIPLGRLPRLPLGGDFGGAYQ